MDRMFTLAGSLLRIALASVLVFYCWQDWPAAQARAGFEALPDFDYRAEAEGLLRQKRFSEALLVTEAARDAQPDRQAEFTELHERIEAERNSWIRRFQEVGKGAWTGTGESAEALGGAIAADLFVFGDVRDLVIQGGRKLRGEKTDPVIIALSAGGILLTVNPAMDLGAALLKFARRMGAMTDAFAKNFVKMTQDAMRRKNADDILRVTDDMAVLSKQARPAGAIAIFKHVDDADDLRRAVQFSQRSGGAFTLWLGGKGALVMLKEGGQTSAEWLLRAGRKGQDGMAYLVRHSTIMLKPHPLLGLIKGFYKGNIPDALLLLAQRYSVLLLGFAVAWLLFELVILGSGLGRERQLQPA
jgi:hypothetical protein